jgi:hypothetical protein
MMGDPGRPNPQHMTNHVATNHHKAGDLGCDFCHRTNATVTIVQSGRSYRCMDVDDCNRFRRQGNANNASCSRCHTASAALERDTTTPGSTAYVCVDKSGCERRASDRKRSEMNPTTPPVDPIPAAWIAVHEALAALPDDEKRCRVIAAVCIALGIELDVNRGPRRG